MPRSSALELLESRRLMSSSPIPGNWNLLWSDEFNATPALPTWVNILWGKTRFGGELENYTPANATVSNGALNLTARRESSGGMPYTSGMINTGGDFATGGPNQPGFSFLYGYVEARMKLTTGQGLWPALWMVPTPYSDGTYHDADGEIDIMEQVGTDPTVTEAHLHHNGVFGKALNTGVDLSAGFHTYGLDWEPDHLTWYIDGKPFYTLTSSVPTVPMYMILNLAVGDANSWPGAPTASTTLPQSMQVDYLRVYKPADSQTRLPGDANLDNIVNMADLAMLALNYGTMSGAKWSGGDFNSDGKVDATDLGILATNWGVNRGVTASSLATSAAPTVGSTPFVTHRSTLADDLLNSPATISPVI